MTAIQETKLFPLNVQVAAPSATPTFTALRDFVRDIDLTRGGIEPYIGVNRTEIGSGTITLIDCTVTIEPGYWVSVGYGGTRVWAGFVQDVNTSYTFIDGKTYTITTLIVLDWVAWLAQYSFGSYAAAINWWNRPININAQIDPTGVNKPIIERSGALPLTSWTFSAITEQMNVADVLDLLANSVKGGYWRATTALPTSSGIDSIIDFNTSTTASNVVLTDNSHTGTPSNLIRYTNAQMVKATSAVSNNVVVTNKMAVSGDMLDSTYQRTNAASITTYGSRLATMETNVTGPLIVNQFPFPSFENYLNRYEDTNFYYSAEQPTVDSGGTWNAYRGSWAYRAFAKTTAVPTVALPLSEVVPVTPGVTYYGFAFGAASAGLNSRARYFIQWQNDAQGIISTTYGAQTNHAALRTWYSSSLSATAPAGAVWARVGLQFSRTTGANIGANSKYWTDAVYFGTDNVLPVDWFDGNSEDSQAYLFDWFGQENASASFQMFNYPHQLAGDFLTDNKDPKYSPISIRLNFQDDELASLMLDTYSRVTFWLNGQRWLGVITGMNHSISNNANGTTRWMVELIIRPSNPI